MAFYTALTGAVLALLVTYYLLPKGLIRVLKSIYPDVIFTLPEKKKDPPRICLTIDDVPHKNVTNLILDLLYEHQVKATFFMISDYGRQNPDLVQRIVQEGHELGNHGKIRLPCYCSTTRSIQGTNSRLWSND